MKKLIASLLVALAAMTALPAAAETFTIKNNAAYNLEIKWRNWKNNYGVHEFDDFLLAGQERTFDSADVAWVKVRAHVPGYGFNHKSLVAGKTHYRLDAYGTATIFNPPNFVWNKIEG